MKIDKRKRKQKQENLWNDKFQQNHFWFLVVIQRVIIAENCSFYEKLIEITSRRDVQTFWTLFDLFIDI